MVLFLIHIGLDTIGDVLLEVVEEETVVVEVIALGTEHLGFLEGDSVELGIDGGNNDRAADGINAGIGNTWRNELAVIGK